MSFSVFIYYVHAKHFFKFRAVTGKHDHVLHTLDSSAICTEQDIIKLINLKSVTQNTTQFEACDIPQIQTF